MNIETTNAPNTTEADIGFIPHVIGSLSFFNADNLEIMRGFKDNEFDLAIVDPPYGIGMDGGNVGYKGFNNFEKREKFNNRTKPSMFYIACYA